MGLDNREINRSVKSSDYFLEARLAFLRLAGFFLATAFFGAFFTDFLAAFLFLAAGLLAVFLAAGFFATAFLFLAGIVMFPLTVKMRD